MPTELNPRMPRKAVALTTEQARKLQRAAKKFTDSRDDMYAVIVECREAGASLAAIAEATGLSPMGISKIVARAEDSSTQ